MAGFEKLDFAAAVLVVGFEGCVERGGDFETGARELLFDGAREGVLLMAMGSFLVACFVAPIRGETQIGLLTTHRAHQALDSEVRHSKSHR
jgi:hypothetical protein